MGQDDRGEVARIARPAALLAVRISPADLDSRVSVRHRIDEPGAHLTDVLGYLRDWAQGVLTVERESGELITIPESDVVAAKVIPPRRVRHHRPVDDPKGHP